MKKIQCVKCSNEVEINILKAVDEHGEEFQCPNCGFIFRYTEK